MLTPDKVAEIVRYISGQIGDSDSFMLVMQTQTQNSRYDEFEMVTENFIGDPDLQQIIKREFN
jgi:hypothetical protein